MNEHESQFSISDDESTTSTHYFPAPTDASPNMADIEMPDIAPHSLQADKVPWPKWDGRVESFDFYIQQLRMRTELCERSANIKCYMMVQTLPEAKKHLIAEWFKTGGEDGKWDWAKFLDFFDLQFANKQAKKAALEELSRMRQGRSQWFTDFVSDFEYKLSVAGGSGWPVSAKLGYLETGINEALQTQLVALDLPENDYSKWLAQVKRVAGKMEALPGYRPRGSTSTKTWYLTQPGTAIPSTVGPLAESATKITVDAQGDTIMGNTSINAIVAAVVSAMKSSGQTRQSDSRPRAPWRTKEAFGRLMELGVCVRCEKAGHLGKNCPNFRPAANPQFSRVSSLGIESTVVEPDSGKGSS